MSELSSNDYPGFLVAIKERIRLAQYEALRSVNKELLSLYWDLGESIYQKQEVLGWGKAVVKTLADDLRLEFPGSSGFSVTNLWLMRQFYAEYRSLPNLQPMVGEISWAKNVLIMGAATTIPSDQVFRPNGAPYASPGQRPGEAPHPTSKALKGRSNRCPNPWPAFTFISSSARKTGNPSSPIPSATHCTHTWLLFCKTSLVLPSSSIPSKTTFTCFSISPGPSLSAKSWRTSKNLHPNGSKPKARNSPLSHGNPDTVLSPFPNPMSKPSANTSPTNANTIARKRFKMNTGHFSNATTSRSMNDMSGIDLLFSTIGAAPKRQILSTNGAALRQPRATPWVTQSRIHQGPTARPKCRPAVRPGLQPLMFSHAKNLGRCPRLAWDEALPRKSTNGATLRQPGASPQEPSVSWNRGPTARPKCRATVRSGLQPSNFTEFDTQGVALGWLGDGALPRKKGGQR